MKIKDLLYEGLSSVLYHATSESALRSILSRDRFILSDTEGDVMWDEHSGAGRYPYYMSFSRSRSNWFARFSEQTVMLTVDGRLLSQRHHGRPVDYFNKQNLPYGVSASEADEMEDRLLSKKRIINGTNRYIRLVEILLPSFYRDYTKVDRFVSNYRHTVELAEAAGIVVYFYTDQLAFYNGQRSKSLTFEGVLGLLQNNASRVVNESQTYDNWIMPPEPVLQREYKVEIELKGRGHLFNSYDEFLEKVKAAPVLSISKTLDRTIRNRSHTETKSDLIDLVSSYRSWPEFRNMKTVNAIYDGFSENKPMELPIILRLPKGELFILTGNTRMDIAFQLGVTPKALVVDL